MDKNEVSLLVNQIRHLILGKEINENMEITGDDLLELQEGIKYLKNCLDEANEFAYQLTIGNLEARTPRRQNFFIGNLKELHANLKHFTWQANQVANGDYSQKVNFLGDFSESFNRMIFQLAERETKLQEQSKMLTESVELLKSIMDGLSEWIVVTALEDNEFVYINKSAKNHFFNPANEDNDTCRSCALKKYLEKFNLTNDYKVNFEHYCSDGKKYYSSTAHLIQWNGKLAYVHFIVDITNEKRYHDIMTQKAYLDELTGVYNRRYCIEKIEEMLLKKDYFTISLLDIDGLKYANDVFGHNCGDMYINVVAKELKSHFRENDVVARIGGDEFVVISKYVSDSEMESRFDNINKILNDKSEKFPMSVSYGTFFVDKSTELPCEKILEIVDIKMYVHKKIRRKQRNT